MTHRWGGRWGRMFGKYVDEVRSGLLGKLVLVGLCQSSFTCFCLSIEMIF